jgi:hypothetical protein
MLIVGSLLFRHQRAGTNTVRMSSPRQRATTDATTCPDQCTTPNTPPSPMRASQAPQAKQAPLPPPPNFSLHHLQREPCKVSTAALPPPSSWPPSMQREPTCQRPTSTMSQCSLIAANTPTLPPIPSPMHYPQHPANPDISSTPPAAAPPNPPPPSDPDGTPPPTCIAAAAVFAARMIVVVSAAAVWWMAADPAWGLGDQVVS